MPSLISSTDGRWTNQNGFHFQARRSKTDGIFSTIFKADETQNPESVRLYFYGLAAVRYYFLLVPMLLSYYLFHRYSIFTLHLRMT